MNELPMNSVGARGLGHAGGRSLALVGVAVALLTVTLALWITHGRSLGPIDDAYVSLRYAVNWAGGEGLSFNPGERVEGYTNFLVVALEALAIRFGADAEAAMTTIGWLSLALLSVLIFLFLRNRVLSGRTLLSALLALVASLNLSLVCWAASGLEVCLYAALLLWSLHAALGRPESQQPAFVAVLLTLAGMTRPEAIVFAPLLAGVLFARRRRIADPLRFILAFGFLFGTYFNARWVYFDQPFPNTFYAKLDYGSGVLALRGLLYVWDFVRAVPLLWAGALACLLWLRGAPAWVGSALSMLALHTAVVIYEGGDHFAMFRFMAPALPLLGALVLYPLLRLVDPPRLPSFGVRGAALAGCLLLAVSGLSIGSPRQRGDYLADSQLQRFELEVYYAREWSALGIWLRDAAPSRASLATIAIGAIGFHSGLTLIDPHGIIDPVIAHSKAKLGRDTAGHEKYDVGYVLSQRPSYMLIGNRISRSPMPPAEVVRTAWGSFNQEVLGTPEFRAAYRYQPIQLAPWAWLNLHVRRDLPAPDPARRTEPGG
ncbi:MAG: hypothetical protein GY769_25565 [bacterium]|nr:hypothetical protein [bacterium]